ncbi:PREDICTED: putative phosphatidate phosphatase isoform X1 [Drosophila arizonae]|nr:PREDICTED: putative phosphatidate phosphatase isoform X1 [Drosophila arizonae]
MSSLRPSSVCDTTPLQRFESQSSSSEEPSSPTAASIIAAVTAAATPTSNSQQHQHQHQHQQQEQHHNNNNNISNNVKVDLQLPPFVGGGAGGGRGARGQIEADSKPQERGTAYIFGRIAVDFSLLGCAGLTMAVLSSCCEPHTRGFFCNDLSLRHPYKESTIQNWMLYLMCVVLPISTILLVEFYRAQDWTRFSHHNQLYSSGYFLCHMELPHWVVDSYRMISTFFFGLGIEQLTTDIAKYTIGRLRPHFFTLCQPVLPDGTTCNDYVNEGRYIEDYVCTAKDISAKQLKNMHLSFPSGHSSFAFFSMIYIVIYLQRRMKCSRFRMLRHLLQFLLVMFAWYTALTRVSDFKHHWSDVLAGSSIGIVYAFLVTSTFW